VSSAGAEVVAFAATAGLILDPWQQFVLDIMLGERADDVAEEEQAVDPLAAAREARARRKAAAAGL
jgi:hypothetical protein